MNVGGILVMDRYQQQYFWISFSTFLEKMLKQDTL